MQSPFYKALKSINSDISADDWSPEKRFPSWKNALEKTSGKLTWVELPLYASLTTSFVPVNPVENELDRERKAGATVHKLIIIKNKETWKTDVRVLTIIPDKEFLSKNATLPLSFTNLGTNFSGYIYIRDWNENLISALKYTNGRRQKFDPFVKETEEVRLMSSSNCDGTWDVVGYREFCITVHQADEPDPCDDPSNWGSRPIYGLTVPGDCDYGSGNDPCLGMSNSDCDCIQFGLCENDQNIGLSLTDFLDSISQNLQTPCFTHVFNEIVETNGNFNSLQPVYQQMLWNVFGCNDSLNIIVGEAAYADYTLDGITKSNQSGNFLNLRVILNSNALQYSSQEYIAATLIHEVFHTLWFAEPIIGNNNDRSHSLMAFQINSMADWLRNYFPNLSPTEATHLCWGGLESSLGYSLLSVAEKSAISATNQMHKDRRTTGAGTVCP